MKALPTEKNEIENSYKTRLPWWRSVYTLFGMKGQPLREPNSPECGGSMNVLSLRSWDCIRIHCQWLHINVGGIRHYFYHWTLSCPASEETGAKFHSICTIYSEDVGQPHSQEWPETPHFFSAHSCQPFPLTNTLVWNLGNHPWWSDKENKTNNEGFQSS